MLVGHEWISRSKLWPSLKEANIWAWLKKIYGQNQTGYGILLLAQNKKKIFRPLSIISFDFCTVWMYLLGVHDPCKLLIKASELKLSFSGCYVGHTPAEGRKNLFWSSSFWCKAHHLLQEPHGATTMLNSALCSLPIVAFFPLLHPCCQDEVQWLTSEGSTGGRKKGCQARSFPV